MPIATALSALQTSLGRAAGFPVEANHIVGCDDGHRLTVVQAQLAEKLMLGLLLVHGRTTGHGCCREYSLIWCLIT